MAAARVSFSTLQRVYPWIQPPLVVSAPMRVFAGPALAVAVSRAGGIGFIGPGVRPTDLDAKLDTAAAALRDQNSSLSRTAVGVGTDGGDGGGEMLPIGVGFQLFDGDLSVALAAVQKHRPRAAWLFAPARGQHDLDLWTSGIRDASHGTQIWIQVGSVAEAVAAATSSHPPDVLVMQGNDAGGHGLARGAGFISLIPEVADATHGEGTGSIALIAAGGIADGRGVAAALAVGASGAVMGTRFLASTEAEIAPGYQRDVVRVGDGGQNTVRTTLFDTLTGRLDWPKQYDGRAIVNQSVKEHMAGVSQAENEKAFKEALKMGDRGWGPEGRVTAYVGSAVGLVREVDNANDIVKNTRQVAREALEQAMLFT